MNTKLLSRTIGYYLMALFAIFVGLYPLRFLFVDYNTTLLGDKPLALINSSLYIFTFYTHILLGGLALIVGFSQFFKSLRTKRLKLHRNLGKVYVVAVLLSGIAGLIIAFFAQGGITAAMGFALLALFWLFTTIKAYTAIKQKDIERHQQWMIRSYALCFAAVTLRLYLPLFLAVIQMEFIPAYKIIAWLCWVPNLLVAEFLIIRRLRIAV